MKPHPHSQSSTLAAAVGIVGVALTLIGQLIYQAL